MKTASQWVDDYMKMIGVENAQAARDNEPEHVNQSEEMFKAIQRDALLSAAEIINARMSMLETWGDDETRENIHIKEIRALRPVYDAILARADGVEDK